MIPGKGGRPRLFLSPEDMIKKFNEYKIWANNNPWYKKELIKSGDMVGKIINIPHQRPISMVGFAVFIGSCERSLRNYGTNEDFEEYFPVYNAIKDEIFEQNVSGALSGVYNPGLTARLHGIRDSQDIEHKGLLQPPSEITVRMVDREDVLKMKGSGEL